MSSSVPTHTVFAIAAGPPGPAPTSAPPPLPRTALAPPPITSSPKFSTRVGEGPGFDAAQFGTADTGADFIPGTHETTIRTAVAPNGVSAKASAPASQPATTTTPNSSLQQGHTGAPPTRTAPYFHPRTSSLLPPPKSIGTNRQPFFTSEDTLSDAALPLTHHHQLQQQYQPNTTRPPYYHHPHPHPPLTDQRRRQPRPQQPPEQRGQGQQRQPRDNYEELYFNDSSHLNDVAIFPTARAYTSSPPDDTDHRATSSSSTSPPPSTLRHAPQIRSSSAAAIDDNNRTLNRWSLSSSASTRRQSIDSVALHAQVNAQYQSLASAARPAGSPSRKLQKQRPNPATSPGPSRVRRTSPTPVPIPIPPLASLPAIVPLPSLEAEVSTPRASSAADAYPPRRDSLLIKPYEPAGQRSLPISAKNNADEPASNGRRASRAEMIYVERNGGGMPQQPPQSPPHQKGHTRSHSHTNGSNDTLNSRASKDRSSKQPSQKAMLSQALEKANAAVQLDNSRNFVAARLAYSEACDLLHQVLIRTNGEDDRKKLEAISKTYTTRIEELDDILPIEKATPPRRPSRSQNDGLFGVPGDTDDESAMMSTASSGYSKSSSSHRRDLSGSRPANNMPVNPTKFGSFSGSSSQFSPQSTYQPQQRKLSNASDLGLMPPPLSPRRPPSPGRQAGMATPDAPFRADFSMAATRLAPPQDDNTYARGHTRAGSHESVSWLDPIDESGGSNAPSSNHSRSSSMGVRRRHIRNRSGATEAEFDAALDDAIEAAYDDGYDIEDKKTREDGEDVVARALRRVELAKERVRESEREALQLANDREKRLREQLQMEDDEEPGDFLDANDSDEEERILEEMTRGYVIEDFSFGPGNKTRPHIPRASDSSEITSRTWHTSTGSNPQTASTTLTTVSEGTLISNGDRPKPSQAPLPPPTQALPQLPLQRPGSSGNRLSEVRVNDSVRNRRLSGQNPKQLKIETSRNPSLVTGPSTAGTMYFAETPPIAQAPQPPMPKTAGYIAQQRQALTAGARYKQTPSPTPPVPATQENDTTKQPGLRKNYSSSSLRSMNQRGRNLSIAGMDEADMSPGTPLSNQFGPATRLPAVPNLPTPIAAAFKDRITSGSTGGLYLFDGAINDGHLSPADSPTSVVTNGGIPDAPVPLEPCPKGTMLRPFWLMRCLFQTLAHPRGGYLSNKLFVPRDVWKVKGVKLKNVEDKISNCDLLTAALQKLGRVDTCDADAMLEEMQSLESIFEQVQASLTRRLGNSEVGVQSMSALFRDGANGSYMGAGGNLDPESAGSVPRSASVSGKSSFSWRRLRSKNSTPGLNAGPGGFRKESPANMMMDSAYGSSSSNSGANGVASLPMTSQPTSRPSKRDLSAVQFTGPNAGYMASLAKLFDAAQAIDQIARQVDDPGLRHADKTQVGLELCTRHAAEFFAFYICRFVLTDLAILLDKFVKRGSEWVLV